MDSVTLLMLILNILFLSFNFINVIRDSYKYKSSKKKNTEYRPWGNFTVLLEGSRYKIKEIEVNPGESLSYQMHHHRSEHWIVTSGTAKVTQDDKITILSENESTFIPIGSKHRLENPGKIPLKIVEVQNGSYVGEDDIVRFQDIYGRETKA